MTKQNRSISVRARPVEASRSPARMLRIPLAQLSTRGFDVRPILDEYGIGSTEIFDAQATVPTATLYAIYRKVEALAGDPCLGVHLSAWVDFQMLQSLRTPSEYFPVQLALASATLGEGLERLARVYPLACGDSRLMLERERAELRLRHAAIGAPPPLPLREFMVSWWVRLVRYATGEKVVPSAIRLSRGAPASTAEHERMLGQRPVFSAGEDSFSLDLSALDTPLCTADAGLLVELEHEERRQAAASASAPLATRVRSLLDKIYNQPEQCGIDAVAAELGLSARTLTRRLAGEQTTFRKLLDERRSDAARGHLAAGRTVSEVASLLGFSEPGAFHRAFVRWFGRPPSSFRAE